MGWHGPQSGDCSCCGGETDCILIGTSGYSSGDFDILSGSFTFGSPLTCTSTGQIATAVSNPSQSNHSFKGEFPVGRIYRFDYQDANNHFYLERISTTQMRLTEKSGGSDTALATRTIASTTDYVFVCVIDDYVKLNAAIESTEVQQNGYSRGITRLNSPVVVIDMDTSDTIDGFAFYDSDGEGCRPCANVACLTDCLGGWPNQLYVDLGSLGDYVLDLFQDPSQPQACQYQYVDSNTDPCEGPTKVYFGVFGSGFPQFRLDIRYFFPPSSPDTLYATYSVDDPSFSFPDDCFPRLMNRNGTPSPPTGCGYPTSFPATVDLEAI